MADNTDAVAQDAKMQLPPDLVAQQQSIARRQAITQALLQRTLTPLDANQVAGNGPLARVVPLNPLQAVSQALSGAVLGNTNTALDAQNQALANAYMNARTMRNMQAMGLTYGKNGNPTQIDPATQGFKATGDKQLDEINLNALRIRAAMASAQTPQDQKLYADMWKANEENRGKILSMRSDLLKNAGSQQSQLNAAMGKDTIPVPAGVKVGADETILNAPKEEQAAQKGLWKEGKDANGNPVSRNTVTGQERPLNIAPSVKVVAQSQVQSSEAFDNETQHQIALRFAPSRSAAEQAELSNNDLQQLRPLVHNMYTGNLSGVRESLATWARSLGISYDTSRLNNSELYRSSLAQQIIRMATNGRLAPELGKQAQEALGDPANGAQALEKIIDRQIAANNAVAQRHYTAVREFANSLPTESKKASFLGAYGTPGMEKFDWATQHQTPQTGGTQHITPGTISVPTPPTPSSFYPKGKGYQGVPGGKNIVPWRDVKASHQKLQDLGNSIQSNPFGTAGPGVTR